MALDIYGITSATNGSGDLLLINGIRNLDFFRLVGVGDPSVDTPALYGIYLTVAFQGSSRGAPNGEGLLGQAWVAADRNSSNVYILTTAGFDPGNLPGPDPTDVVFISSNDAGMTWSRPVIVNDDPLRPNSWQWFSMMSVAPNGRIDVVWNDTRNSQQPNFSELFYSSSIDGGKTWSPNVAVSPMFDSWIGRPAGSFNQKLGDYYHMVSDNLGANVAYAATFNGEQDVYFLRIGPWDCNGNDVDDAQDIALAASSDCNANDVPDECEYRVDIDGDGLTALGDWSAMSPMLDGPQADPPLSPLIKGGGNGCHELLDADHDGDIDLADFAYLQRVLVSP